MTKFYTGQARNAINVKVKWGNNSKFVLGRYGSCAVHSIIFHIKFEDVQAIDDKVIFQTAENAVKISVKGK